MKIMITGGSGTLGFALCEKLITREDISEVVIFSRSEDKQVKMRHRIESEKIKYIIGDITDYDSVVLATRGVDVVLHAAAMKHIDISEENAIQATNINVLGTTNLLKASLINNVKRFLFFSTDKACEPSGTYGISKLMGEKVSLASSSKEMKVSVIRLGNVVGSSGSIFEKWPQQISQGKKISVTSKDMTRFFIEKSDIVDYIISKIYTARGGEIFIAKMDRKNIYNIAKSFTKDENEIEIIGLRQSEKLHEKIISSTEFGSLVENDNEFIIMPGNDQLPDISSIH